MTKEELSESFTGNSVGVSNNVIYFCSKPHESTVVSNSQTEQLGERPPVVEVSL